MFIDGRSLEAGTTLEADLCIVGGGAAGLTTALDFLGGAHSVIILESGGVEASISGRDPEPLPAGSAAGRLLSRRNRYLDHTRARGFGGLGDTWQGSCRPLDPEDLAERDWVPESGWPLAANELAPWLARAAELLGVDSTAGAEPPPALGEGLDRSWLPFADRLSIAGLFRSRFASAANARVVTHATVTQLVLEEPSGDVAAAQVRCLDGPRLEVRARTFVLAAGVVENARLLLASNRQRGRGLGNENDLVGRYFMEQIVMHAGTAVVTGRPGVLVPYGAIGLPAGGERPPRAVLRLPRARQERHELLNALVMLSPPPPGDALEEDVAHLAAAGRALEAGASPVGSFARAAVTVRGEQIPAHGSRVRLGGKRDPFGVPLARLHWIISWDDTWSLRRTAQLFGESLGIAQDGRLRLSDDPKVDRTVYRWAGHQSGTTRMSRDPARGVVDPDCRVHAIGNLYVAGSSVFPTSGCSGPMLTLLALALRLGAHLRGLAARLRDG